MRPQEALELIKSSKNESPQAFYRKVYDACTCCLQETVYRQWVLSLAAHVRDVELGEIEMTRKCVYRRFKKMLENEKDDHTKKSIRDSSSGNNTRQR